MFFNIFVFGLLLIVKGVAKILWDAAASFFCFIFFLLSYLLYICKTLIKQKQMKTQKDDLKAEVKELESKLKFATINSDAFTQMSLYKRLVEVKSLLINIV